MGCAGAGLLLSLLLFQQACSEEPMNLFKAGGGSLDLADCYRADHLVTYRSVSEGRQLIANISENLPTPGFPAHLQERVTVKRKDSLLGLRVGNLTELDSGTYVRECWRDRALVSNLSEQLLVCKEELSTLALVTKDGVTELQCSSSWVGQAGISVRWYWETFPAYSPVLFLDSSVSMTPIAEELRGALEVKEHGTVLKFNQTLLRANVQFHCLVMKDKNCLSFQSTHLLDPTENWNIFTSEGEEILIPCSAHGNHQKWETPLGDFNSSSDRGSGISLSHEGSNFSLIIPSVAKSHEGTYECLSSLLHTEYSLLLCDSKESQHRTADEGGTVTLECSFDGTEKNVVQWHRHHKAGFYETIWNAEDGRIRIPDDLKNRLQVRNAGKQLDISNLNKEDALRYRCVVTAPYYDYEYEPEGDDFEEELDEDPNEEFSTSYGECFFKGETTLSVSAAAFNIKPYLVGITVGLLVLVAVAVVAVIVKKRRSTQKRRNQTIPLSGADRKQDPDSTVSLASEKAA